MVNKRSRLPGKSPFSVDEILNRGKVAFGKTDLFKPMWIDAYMYCLPQREDVHGGNAPGQVKGDRVFDSTGVHSTAAFANRITTNLFPFGQDFIKLEAGPAVKIGEDRIVEGTDINAEELGNRLQDAQEKFHSAIWRSNFATASNELLLDLGIGTGVMQVLEGDFEQDFNFVAAPAPSCGLEEGPWGSVSGVFRKYEIAVGVIEQQWSGPRGAVLPKELKEKMAENPMEQVEVTESTLFDRKRRLWFYEVIWDKTKLLKKPWVYEEVSPWMTPRWIKAAGETWGRGPILFALPDIRTVNKVVEFILKNASLSIAGVYTGVDDGVLNPATAEIAPGAIIQVARNNGHPQGASLLPLERAGDFDVSQLLLDDLRQNIRRFLFDRGLPDDMSPIRSATEIIKRLEELQMDIGAAFGRLMEELIKPLVVRCLRILDRRGLIDFPLRIDGQNIQITVTSPLAQQQNMEDMKAAMAWLEILQLLGPEFAMFNARLEIFGVWVANKLGVDQELIRDDQDQKKIKATVEQMIAQMVAAQQQAAQPGGAGPPAPAQQPEAATLQAAE